MFCLALLLGACLSEIELKLTEDKPDNLVITGTLTKANPSSLTVLITRLTPLVGFEKPELLTNANVILKSESGMEYLVPEEGEGKYGLFFLQDEIKDGEQYQLIITVANSTYISSLEPILAVPKAENLSVTEIVRSELNGNNNIIDQSYLNFYIDTPLESNITKERAFLKWDFEAVYQLMETQLAVTIPPGVNTCYYTQTLGLDNISVFNGPESRKDKLTQEFLIEEKLDYRFSRGFYLNVYQQSISKNAFNYWKQIKSITDLSGNFFEDPPSKILGNFENLDNPEEEVFGYFYATQVDTIRLFIPGNQFEVNSICPSSAPPGDPSVRAICYNCLEMPGSTLVKPKYWVE